MPSVDTMINRMHALRDEMEDGVIGEAAEELQRIFARAEVALARNRRKFTALMTGADGNLQRTPENIEAARRIMEELDEEINVWIREAGKAWADAKLPAIHEAGRELARVNFDVDGVSPELVRAAFENVSTAERAVLRVGFENTYRIMNTVGDDVADWFRRTMLDAIIDGVPVQGRGDTLVNRLFESGRIKPITIKTESGRIIRRSVQQRATTIARVESARLSNQTHEVLAREVFGGEAVYINSNPRDSRTTDICRRASTQKAMTMEQWEQSEFGKPPRLNPFHMCRSVLIGGMPEWFKGR